MALVALRLADRFGEGRWAGGVSELRHQIHAAENQLGILVQPTVEGRFLRSVIEMAATAAQAGTARPMLPALLAYGAWLDEQMRLEEALDVVETACRLSDLERADLVEAHLLRARVLRLLSRYRESQAAYQQAGELALEAGDHHSERLSRMGQALVICRVGNLPEANRMLEKVAAEARDGDDRDIQGRAAHSLALVASEMGRHAASIRHAYDAFELYEADGDRLRALSDVGMGFKALGHLSAAEDAFTIVIRQAVRQDTRINAMLEMLDLAGRTQDRVGFERLRRELNPVREQLNPDAQVDFAIKCGVGLGYFGRRADAEAELLRAITLAEQYNLNAYLFTAEAALRALRDTAEVGPGGAAPAPAIAPSVGEMEEETARVAGRLQMLRGAVLAP